MATISGTAGNDNLSGDGADDVISGLAGGDRLRGRDGADALFGGKGGDTLIGGKGDDTVTGGKGDDLLIFGDGTDMLSGGDGNDRFEMAGDTLGFIYGGSGFDVLDLSAVDTADGVGVVVRLDRNFYQFDRGRMEPSVHIGEVEEIIGTNANYTYIFYQDSFTLWGLDGDDYFEGFDGEMEAYGGKGNDVFRTAATEQMVYGGRGNDEFELDDDATSFSNVLIAGGKGNDKVGMSVGEDITVDLRDITFKGIEHIELDANGSDTIFLMNAGQLKNGFSSDVFLEGRFSGSSGSVTIQMGNTKTFDMTDFDVSSFQARGELRVLGDSSSETITGSDLFDYIVGGKGNDTIKGGIGLDYLDGGRGRDDLRGGNANDWIIGGVGADKMKGGGGSDTFVLKTAQDSGVGSGKFDEITDFNSGIDFINVGFAGVTDYNFIGQGKFTDAGSSEYRFETVTNGVMLQIDDDGNGTADLEVFLRGATTFAESDLYYGD